MKKFKSIIVLGAAALAFAGCYKDNGNYTYKNLSNAFVDTSKFSGQMVIRQNDPYTVTPVFVNGVDPSKLTYEWRLTKVESTPDPFTGKFTDTVLSTKQNLSGNMYFSPGNYMLRLHVFDPANGNVAQVINRPLAVSSFAMQGLMLLHGDATSCDVSIIVNTKVNTLVPTGTDSIQRNVFSITNGKKIEGEARSVNFNNHGSSGADSKVYVFTYPNGGYRTDFGTLKTLSDYNGLFSPAPSSNNFTAYGVSGANEVLINNGGLYYQGQIQPAGFIPFGVQSFLANSVSPGNYVATPYYAMDIDNVTASNAPNAAIFYDQNARRFLAAKNDKTVGTFTGTAPTGGFSLSAPGKWMVYAEQGFSPGRLSPYFSKYWYCVMQDVNFTNPVSPKAGTRRVHIVDLGRLPDPAYPGDNTKNLILTSNQRGIIIDTISNATDIDAAKYFSFGNRGPIMFYATDTKIYVSNNYITSNLYYDISTTYAGNVITCMQIFKSNGHPSDGQILYVALYDGTKSTLLQIPINGITGAMTGEPMKAYTNISGKISAMNYKPF
ncbi:PKD-like family lipoprotein [Pinibacter soli]|uniref:PKD-like family lipoprotein n=1 Tax=Pinibacter soli TaxID=3044211 RepID=A0ABT6RCK6_9BACT|nr:PKD-like family lipoprotein [Pinibacter soli]MDI3320285.1 PKD-like family lipoprotein [Pinibacter soli]